MAHILPEIIRKNGFSFSWNEEDVWNLDVPQEEMSISELTWHFELPFWDHNHQSYCLSAHDVMAHPDMYQDHFKRIEQADTKFPIDIALHPETGRWVILDGLHRLIKLYLAREKMIRVRKIPLDMIVKKREV